MLVQKLESDCGQNDYIDILARYDWKKKAVSFGVAMSIRVSNQGASSDEELGDNTLKL